MSILIADNFAYQGRKPLDSRIVLDTIADMKTVPESIIYEGILVYNKETKKFYQFDPTNTEDTTLGKWREFTSSSTLEVKELTSNTSYQVGDYVTLAANSPYIALVLQNFTTPQTHNLIDMWYNALDTGNICLFNDNRIENYSLGATYLGNTLVVNQLTGEIYLSTQKFTTANIVSPNGEHDYASSFQADIDAGNLIAISSNRTTLCEFQSSTTYKKDTLVYCGDRLGRIVSDYTSANKSSNLSSFEQDVADSKIIVDKISITDLDEQLLKAIPIVAFVTKHDIPRFESNITLNGSIPKFRDGSSLSLNEKKGCNFFYIIDSNNELTGLAMIMNYDDINDTFTVNAMKYGVGASDFIIKTDNTLTQVNIGNTQIVAKDALLDPVLTISSTTPENTNLIWYESNALDSTGLNIGTINVKKYNSSTSTWEEDTLIINNGDIVRNSNGSEWEYYGIYNSGNILIALTKYQLVYDINGILGKIMNIDRVNHSITIETIHSNADAESSLQEDIQANTQIGAAAANTLYPEGMTFTEFLKKIAIKELLATINFTVTNAGLKKQGTIVPAPTLTTTITNIGNIPIQSIAFYLGNTQLDSQTYTSGTNTYTYAYDSDITTNQTFATILYQNNNQTVRKESKFVFVNPRYIGVVNTLTPSATDITALTEDLSESRAKDYTISMNDARICYAYPSSMGNLTTIKDSNNFEYINSFTKTTATINGETYNVYVLTDSVTVLNFKWSFK